MTKLEKIKEAYGNKYNSSVSDTDGWAPWNCIDLMPLPDSYQTKNIGNTTFIRPISLNGIEDNNGWQKIESEDDLPTDRTKEYLIVVDGLKGYRQAFYDKDKWCFFHIVSDGTRHLSSYNSVTHWKPIVKDLPPIY
ncbi:hypothetical protein TH53_19830 [Pedobacter lusitanus]|uniref:DUF551 domain-containing protein n=1 Tax=Pedobacter lusitanus TaxID=1503925 RepID=A0A0D0GHH9_9SPHI|nr:hypothetical protein [Pedobacter lusitanus]KIO75590.1 hypothetical protein TH53_19830 [Pedobacter lusitanus]